MMMMEAPKEDMKKIPLKINEKITKICRKSINLFRNAKKVKRKPNRWREVSKPWKIEIEVVKKKKTEEIQEIKNSG